MLRETPLCYTLPLEAFLFQVIACMSEQENFVWGISGKHCLELELNPRSTLKVRATVG